MRSLIIFSLILLVSLEVYTQNSLSGKVLDHESKEPLIEAHIYIPDLQKGTTTNFDGNFEMENLPKGSFLVEIRYLSYSTQVVKVQLDGSVELMVELEPSVIEMSEVVVSGPSASTKRDLNPIPTLVIDDLASNKTPSENVIDAIAKQPGVSQITTGGAVSKPVIRGLGYNRVVVLNNNIRQEGQQWGDEHGVEIDEYSIDRVEIIKGPGSLMYGSDAMAGVIHFLAPKPVSEGEVLGHVSANYQSNNQLQGYSAMTAGNLNGINWLARVTSKTAGNFKNKFDGPVYNSGFNELNFNGFVGLNKKWGYSQLHFSRFDQAIGLVEGERDDHGNFIRQKVVNDTMIQEQTVTDNDLSGYGIDVPSQHILHQKVSSNSKLFFKRSVLSLNLAFQQNNRQEFANPLDETEAELYFLLNTFNYDVKYLLPEFREWQPSVGLSGMIQHSLNKGEEFLIPEYDLFDGGIFAFVQRSFDELHVSGGLRGDLRRISSLPLYLDANDEPTGESNPDAITKFKEFQSTFSNISASVGASYEFTDELTGKVNVSRGFRSPNMAELGSNGIHEGTFRYEVGNSQLKPETSLQVDAGMIYNNEHVSFELGLFHNSIQNYIYLQKLHSASGEDSIVDVSKPVPVFGYVQGDARLYGGEFTIDIHPHPLDWLHFENSFSYVRGAQRNQPDSTKYLPFMPAPNWQSELRANFKKVGHYLHNIFLRVEMDYVFRQDKIFAAYGTETPTEGYALLNAGIGGDVKGKSGTKLFSISLSGSNLLDRTYQSHLSRLKYAPENLVTGRRGVYNMGRNISLRLAIPLGMN